MVNDPKTNELIRWSDTGDSFLVPEHERFAREVLPMWFKHQNFSSFVRQLNMYGFHKVQHLQQGALKSESVGPDFWNFTHEYFIRGHPELLHLIQRKKQAPNQEDKADAEANNADGTSPTNGVVNGQVWDINAVVHGLNAIRAHQNAIITELNSLRQSNEHLWREAMEARSRAKKQQDTINRIVKFLAGVFG
ncbi:hypothetical protein FISHEDRAFT_12273, partial [Fistulina hepatica ATCC 64428]